MSDLANSWYVRLGQLDKSGLAEQSITLNYQPHWEGTGMMTRVEKFWKWVIFGITVNLAQMEGFE